jgi:hypothetical protein
MAVTATTDTSATPMQRAEELLRQMTLEEKAMQLASVVPLALLSPDGARCAISWTACWGRASVTWPVSACSGTSSRRRSQRA